MTKEQATREALELALEALNLVQIRSEDGEDLTPKKARKAITAIKEALAQPEQRNASEHLEPVAWRETHSKIIKALAGIVTVPTPDKLFDLDAIPRDPVMGLVQQIKAAIDGYKPPQQSAIARKPLTDDQRNWIVATCPTPRHIIDTVEKMHGIKE